MSIFDRLRNSITTPAFSTMAALYPVQYSSVSLEAGPTTTTRRHFLDVLLAYALCNDLYRQIGLTLTGETGATSFENIRSLRNPVKQFVNFYQDMLWTNPQTIEAENENIIEPLEKLRRWSNWSHGDTPTHRASLAAFQFALFGELFIKTGQRPDGRPYQRTLDPRHVDEDNLDVDERGYVEFIRIDMPVQERDRETGTLTEWMRTEVWDRTPRVGLNAGNWPTRVRVWQYDTKLRDRDDLSKLSDEVLVSERIFSGGGRGDREGNDGELPVDWIPIAYAAFEVMDDGRGWSPIVPALEAIDEANRVTTGEHRALSAAEKIMRTLHSDNVDKDGRPKPPPPVESGATIEVGGETWIGLPSGWMLGEATPRFDFAGIRGVVADQVDWLYRELPELQFADSVREMGDPSGRAIHYRLAPILKRPARARAIAEACKILANQHALTIGAIAGHWSGIGTYENGDFEHQFKHQPFLPTSQAEKAEEAMQLSNFGNPRGALLVAGYSEAQANTAIYGEADGGPMLDATGVPAESVDPQKGLNGAQLKAIRETLGEVLSGAMPASVAVELLIAVGLDQERAQKMVDDTVAAGAPPAALSGRPERVASRAEQLAQQVVNGNTP